MKVISAYQKHLLNAAKDKKNRLFALILVHVRIIKIHIQYEKTSYRDHDGSGRFFSRVQDDGKRYQQAIRTPFKV